MESLFLSNSWFETGAKRNWDKIIPVTRPKKILEIGSYEGASACYLIDSLGSHQEIEIHCIDAWSGLEAKEEATANMWPSCPTIESRFDRNLKISTSRSTYPVALHKHKKFSDLALCELFLSGKVGYFDFIYIDGSHYSPDVAFDAILSFKLLKAGGIMAFDDYLYAPNSFDPTCPKYGIDFFINLHYKHLTVLPGYSNEQVYIKKR